MKLQEVQDVQKGMTHDRSFRRAVEGQSSFWRVLQRWNWKG
jgi:hypothetical protein